MNQENELPLALRAAYMALHRRTDIAMGRYGVTADQFVLLLALEKSRSLTQRELSDQISSDPSTVRAMLVLLERNDLIQRSPHRTDSRARTVKLTPKGKRKLKKLWSVGESIRSELYGALNSREASLLIRSLERISNALSK